MSDRRVSVRDRVLVLDQLNACAWWLNKLAGWLGSRGVETEADMLDQARARHLGLVLAPGAPAAAETAARGVERRWHGTSRPVPAGS
jgi:hypothetical protein